MSKTTPILLTTTTMSSIASDIMKFLNTDNHPPLSKSAMLTIMARRIRGPRADWGHLTASDTTVVANGAERFAPLLAQAATAGFAPGDTVWIVLYDERDDWSRAPNGPFASRDDALAFVANDTWWKAQGYAHADVMAELATTNRFCFFAPDDDGEETGSPYSIDIVSLVLPARS